MGNYLANSITGCRIVCSVLMLFVPVCSVPFYILYLLCGVSDMTDGTVARMTNSVSAFGAKLDTAADCIFAAVSLLKWLPVVHIPGWLWIWIAGIASIRLGNILFGLIRRKTFLSVHTVLNKVTGLLLFLLPFTLYFIEITYSSAVVCAIATCAAIQEVYYVITGHEVV